MRFVFLFLVLIVLEVWSIIEVGDQIGILATLILLVAGFIFGSQVLRAQGIASLIQSVKQASSGQSPMSAIAGGFINAFAGILLIIPGFISDVIAIIILLPFVRNIFVKRLLSKGSLAGFASRGFGGSFGMGGLKPGANDDFMRGNVYDHDGPARPPKSDNFIEGKGEIVEGEIVDSKPDKK